MKNTLRRLPIFTTFAGASLTIALMIPSLYFPATGSSHPKCSGLPWTAMATAVITFFACFAQMWYGKYTDLDEVSRPVQFGLRSVFVPVTIAALPFAIFPFASEFVARCLVAALALSTIVWLLFQECETPSFSAVILVCTYFPFVRFFLFNEPIGRISGLLESSPVGPGFFAAELMSYFVDGVKRQHLEVIAAGWLACS